MAKGTKDNIEFEEGKQIEEYVDPSLVAELDGLKIDPEPNPESEQRLETVAEPPVRNEKKKPELPKTQPPKETVPTELRLTQLNTGKTTSKGNIKYSTTTFG